MTSAPYSVVQSTSSIQLQQPSSSHLRRQVELMASFIFLRRGMMKCSSKFRTVVISSDQLELSLSVHQRRQAKLTDDILLSLCS